MADKVKQVALDEAERVKAQTIQAARSAAYLYPLRVRLPHGSESDPAPEI